MNYKGNLNRIYSVGTLTIKCFVYPKRSEDGAVIKYHGTKHVATIKDVYFADIKKVLHEEIEEYLKRCKYKDCEKNFSWKFETL